MQTVREAPVDRACPPPWGSLQTRVRALYLASGRRTGAWLTEALASDSATKVTLTESVGASAGVARMREEAYDVVLVSHEPPELDALELVEGLRASGAEEPFIILGAQSEQELDALAFEVGAEGYVCVHATTTRTLNWIVSRAIERRRLIRDNRRLTHAERQRLRQEHQEADRLLAEQRGLLKDLKNIRDGAQGGCDDDLSAPAGAAIVSRAAAEPIPLPPALIEHYRDLLRAYVIMGAGNLGQEMSALADLLVSAEVDAAQTMQLHLSVLEDLVKGLGNRSARHVMVRADLLALEIMVHLSEDYRRRYLEHIRPPRQLLLPF